MDTNTNANTNVIGIISNLNRGYTVSVNALASLYPTPTIVDFMDEDLVKTVVSTTDQLDIVSCADFGINTFIALLGNEEIASRYENGEIRFILSSDRHYDVSLEQFTNGITLIMPEKELDKYREANSEIVINGIHVDIVACSIKEEMVAAAEKFAEENPDIAEIFDIWLYEKFFFLGGRYQTGPGQWDENTEKIFREEAETVLNFANGEACVIGTHGLRTFTKGDGNNDFGPFNAFIDVLKENRKPSQEFLIFAQEETENGKRTPVLIIIDDNVQKTIPLNGGCYYYLLNEAVGNGVEVAVTVEQMNFLSEFLNLGGDFSKVTVSYWPLCGTSNVEAYQSVMAKTEAGEVILDARAAWQKELEK